MIRLLAGIEERRAAVVTGQPSRIQARLPLLLQAPVGERVRRAVADNVAQRVWRRDASLWGGPGVPGDRGPARLADRVRADARARGRPARVRRRVPGRRVHRRGAARDGRLLARARGHPPVVRRDPRWRCACRCSTRPIPTRCWACRTRSTSSKTLFVVSSKSGSTIETLSHYRYFKALVGPDQFVVVTDPGSPLERLAADDGLRRCFLNPPDIGGRYSVLSYFGLVPAALDGREHRGAAAPLPGGRADVRALRLERVELRAVVRRHDRRAARARAATS